METLRTNPELVEHMKQGSLELLKDQLAEGNYPGYPDNSSRMTIHDTKPHVGESIIIPKGPWWVNPDEVDERCDRQDFPTVKSFDSYDRPLHPWFSEMIVNRKLGIVAGKGFYWNWGPNYTADPIILRHDQDEPHVLLIERGDTGKLALPGGFVDDSDETLVHAAIREAQEEAFIDPGELGDPKVIYEGPVADLRTTAHAWAETTAVRFDIDDKVARKMPLQPYEGGDDAAMALWLPASKIGNYLFGSHRLLIEQALEDHFLGIECLLLA